MSPADGFNSIRNTGNKTLKFVMCVADTASRWSARLGSGRERWRLRSICEHPDTLQRELPTGTVTVSSPTSRVRRSSHRRLRVQKAEGSTNGYYIDRHRP